MNYSDEYIFFIWMNIHEYGKNSEFLMDCKVFGGMFFVYLCWVE